MCFHILHHLVSLDYTTTFNSKNAFECIFKVINLFHFIFLLTFFFKCFKFHMFIVFLPLENVPYLCEYFIFIFHLFTNTHMIRVMTICVLAIAYSVLW
jgi:hypothetical protein